jgi:hypothetical protein
VGVSTRRAATQSRVPAAARQPRRAGAGPAALAGGAVGESNENPTVIQVLRALSKVAVPQKPENREGAPTAGGCHTPPLGTRCRLCSLLASLAAPSSPFSCRLLARCRVADRVQAFMILQGKVGDMPQ